MTLAERYVLARWAYAIGEDIGIGDIEYRQIEEQLKQEDPDNEYLHRSWSNDPCPIELLEKLGRMDLFRDIKFSHQSESIPSINNESDFEAMFISLNEPSRLSYKLDGWNIQCNYYNGKPVSADTRGRTGNALGANAVLKIIPQSIPLMGKVKVTGELVHKNKTWEDFKLETGKTSQRAAVSTALARDMTEYLEFVAFNIRSDAEEITRDQYDMLRSCGFKTPQSMTVSNYAQLQKAIKILGKQNKVYAYPTDGLVIENSQYQLAIRIGEWQESSLCSYVESYEENVGIYNNPIVVNIHPVVHEGAVRRQVSVTNLQYILENELKIGSPIAFDIRSQTTAVLNEMGTRQLHKEWAGKYEEFRDMVNTKEGR